MTTLRARASRIGLTLTVFAALSSLFPSQGHAATTYCLNAWGQSHPVAWCDVSFTGTVTPIDQPYGRGERGDLYVRGVLTPGARVTVSVSDGVHTIRKTVSSSAVDDPGAHKPAGAFNAEFNAGHFEDTSGNTCPKTIPNQPAPVCHWVIGLTDLGAHTVRAGASPESRDPADYGASVLTVTAVDVNVTATTTVTKYAASFNDQLAPALIAPMPTLPPTRWCHIPEPVAPPAGTTGSCAPQTSTCKIVIGPVTQNQRCSTGRVNIFGIAEDADPFEIGSEVADVRLKISQGTEVLEEMSILSGRRGTRARFDHTVKIDDYEPNFSSCDPAGLTKTGCYNFKVTITDAWGRVRTLDSGPVTVMPY